MNRWCAGLLLGLLLTHAAIGAAQEACIRTADMPPGLRMDRYHAPTPACVPGGVTLDTAELQTLIHEAQPILIDVLALYRRVDDGFGSTWLQNAPHESLPGSIWLPSVGYGEIEPDLETWFKDQLATHTTNDKKHPLVFYCVADCWMSWNAVQRVSSYGYERVYWYKDGVDGWQEHDGQLVEISPAPVDPDHNN